MYLVLYKRQKIKYYPQEDWELGKRPITEMHEPNSSICRVTGVDCRELCGREKFASLGFEWTAIAIQTQGWAPIFLSTFWKGKQEWGMREAF